MATSSRGEKKRVLHVGSYEVGRTLGNGSFGKVKLGTNVFTKDKVAIKFFNHRKFATVQQIENTHREIEIMKLLSHPNIVKLIDVIEKADECTTYLIAEYVSGGELFDYIVANGTVKEKQARHFMRQIVSAVEFCHANLIVHRDLKPENLLLDASGNIKISDFGLSNMIEPGKLLDSFCGSPLYAAPEILLAERYVGPPIDVWSIGVILYALLCGHLPWNGESQAEISHNSIKGIYDEPQEISMAGRDIIRRMLNPDPKARISIAEIRKHKWMNESYDALPPSMLTARQPVFEVREEIISQVVGLGFKNEEEIRKQILDNECCQVVTMYHLILDRKVAEEMAEVKQKMLGQQQANNLNAPSNHPTKVTPPTNPSKIINMKAKKPAFLLGGSPMRTPNALAAIVEEEANEVSALEWDKIQQTDMEEEHEPSTDIVVTQEQHMLSHSSSEIPEVHESNEDSVSYSGSVPSNYHHQHDSMQHQHDASLSSRSPRRAEPSRVCDQRAQRTSAGQGHGNGHGNEHGSGLGNGHDRSRHQHRGGRAQLCSSTPVPGLVDRGRHRRFSVATPNDQLVHNRSLPQAANEFAHGSPQQQQQPQRDQPPSDAAPPPRGRKFSLDSRAIAELQQMAQEHGGSPAQSQGPGAPRLVKGVFKSSTTTTRPPSEAAKLVKKVLSNSSFFVKRKSPYIFECLDEETGVKFQLEVCKISQLDMTGIHLKRLIGDIWAYKNMCSTLVNKLAL
eukprot:Phypoly_transcript_03033.p1 GENE.Phypoly_transcript_03033~~Phypoly_transcript_03033.p1  ORF type:complete len:735 (+),score=94.37 Phypoly_transcript_03033:242-2446(+)